MTTRGKGECDGLTVFRVNELWPRMYSGMAPIIRAVLSSLIGEEDSKDIEIVSNEVDIHADGTWSIKYRHPSRCVLPRVLPGNVLSH